MTCVLRGPFAGWMLLLALSGASVAQQIGATPGGQRAPAGAPPKWTQGFAEPGTSGPLFALEVYDDGRGSALYAGGILGGGGGVPASGVVRYDGNGGWEALGSGLNAQVSALLAFGPRLYAGGWFTQAGGAPASYIASWDGMAWSALASGMFAPGGAAGVVDALVSFDDGSGPALYAGGYFTIAGGVTVNRIARWDGSAWSALGAGPNVGTGARVLALAVYQGKLYAGGEFTTAGGVAASRIAAWDGSSWSAVGSGTNAKVLALAVFGGKLYAGGEFTSAGGAPANQIASWDGGWAALGSGTGGIPPRVKVLEVYDDGAGPALFVGGDFTTAGGLQAERLARWSGTQWSAVGNASATVNGLAVLDAGAGAELYAGGYFQRIDELVVNSIASFDGAGWSALEPDQGVGGPILSLESWDDGGGRALYAGGEFEQAGTVEARFIARLRDGQWSPLGSGIEDDNGEGDVAVWALEVFDDGTGEALYAAGTFVQVGGVIANHVARWDGRQWSALHLGTNGAVYALRVFDDGAGPALYAGGVFTSASGTPGTSRIARWDGAQWSSVGSGIPGGSIWSFEVFDDGNGAALYAGGNFGIAGAQNIARWDGSSWSDLDLGVSGGTFPFVYALAVHDGGSGAALYAGGRFTNAGSLALPVNRVARWDGAAWSALGSGMGGGSSPYVFGLASFREGASASLVGGPGPPPALFATGQFTTAGGVGASRIARWDGTAWSSVGGGLSGGYGYALRSHAASGEPVGLHVGGSFSATGTVGSSNLGRWGAP